MFSFIGTDSRIGFGYRLGDHADFQVQLEIGPQKETQPIGTSSSASKRNVNAADQLIAEKALKKEEVSEIRFLSSKIYCYFLVET